MKLVADAGPIIALAKVDRLALLPRLFAEIWLPATVEHEVLARPGPDSRRVQLALQTFLRVSAAPVQLPPSLGPATRLLDDGERAVIALGSTLAPPVTVLMDDAAGRRVARQAGLPLVGFAGVLITARERGLIDGVVSLLLEARERGYWLDDALIDVVRRRTGE